MTSLVLFLLVAAANAPTAKERCTQILRASALSDGENTASNRDTHEKYLRTWIQFNETHRQIALRKETKSFQRSRPSGERAIWVKAYIKDLQGCRGYYLSRLSPVTLGRAGVFCDISRWRTAEQQLKVMQIVDGQNMIVECTEYLMRPQTLWLKGFPTRGLIDDEVLDIEIVARVSGTKQYATVLGSTKTILLVEPFLIDMQLWRTISTELGLLEGTSKNPGAPSRPPGVLRTWTNKTEQFEAEYIGQGFGKVRLRRANGKEITLSLDQLSEEDQRWVQNHRKKTP